MFRMKIKYRIQSTEYGTHWVQRYDSQWFNFYANYWHNIGNGDTLKDAQEYLDKYKSRLVRKTVYEEDYRGNEIC